MVLLNVKKKMRKMKMCVKEQRVSRDIQVHFVSTLKAITTSCNLPLSGTISQEQSRYLNVNLTMSHSQMMRQGYVPHLFRFIRFAYQTTVPSHFVFLHFFMIDPG